MRIDEKILQVMQDHVIKGIFDVSLATIIKETQINLKELNPIILKLVNARAIRNIHNMQIFSLPYDVIEFYKKKGINK